MKPLNVALFVKSSPNTPKREDRVLGWWSYPTPEFAWEHFFFNNFQQVDISQFKDRFDLIVHEDSGFATYVGSGPPTVYVSIDSFLTPEHRRNRLVQAGFADLVLVDIDELEPFKQLKKPVYRFPHAINDHLYKPLEKDTDIVYHCSANIKQDAPRAMERSIMRRFLGGLCQEMGWSYRRGALAPDLYAKSMGSARVVVNTNRNELSRNHRTFDAMACGACLLTDPPHAIPEDGIQEGVHYVAYKNDLDIPQILERLLDGEWQKYAEAGHKLVMERHTWTIRAQQLRQILAKEFRL